MPNFGAWCTSQDVEDGRLDSDGEGHDGGWLIGSVRRYVVNVAEIVEQRNDGTLCRIERMLESYSRIPSSD